MTKILNEIGEIYQQFRLNRSLPLPELKCTLKELTHLPTGAQVIHLANDDPENLFCLSFQTLPDSSDGVAHILEHTVLCGSEKYPIKDPFFAMGRRSLNTYMNALTGADFTCYPAASQVPQDFYNLLEVYLDAVFHPRLDRYSFMQEGHRLEFTIPTDSSSPLEYKGIVFNEMKGSLSSPTTRMIEAINAALYPDVTYGRNSGGDPAVIPRLTYEKLIRFYKTFYHPSRCLFFFYGNLPLKGHLDFILSKTLQNSSKLDPLPPIPKQPRFTSPRSLQLHYPSLTEEEENKAIIAFGWLTCSILEQEELLALSILAILLMDTDASPLKKALLRSNLCRQASCYLENDWSEIPFVIFLKGCQSSSALALENVIKETLFDLANHGIPRYLVENAIHQVEFHRSEIGGDHGPFGLSLFMRSGLLKQHGAIPEEGLQIHSLFERLRRSLEKDPRYLEKILARQLLENPHHVKIVMEPNSTLAAQELQEEKSMLERIQTSLSIEEKEGIVKESLKLAAFQKRQEEEDIDILPKITLKDVPQKAQFYSLKQESISESSLKVFHYPTFTNKIVYATLAFDLPYLSVEELPLVRLFSSLVAQVGCSGRSYAENLEFIQANTGGIGACLGLNIQANNQTQFTPTLLIKGKALHYKVPQLFSLLKGIVTSLQFNDVPRLKEVIQKQYTALEASLSQNALRYAINLAASRLTLPSKIAELWHGLDFFWMMRDLATQFDQRAEEFVASLQSLQDRLLGIENPHLILTCEPEAYETIAKENWYGLHELPTKPLTPWTLLPSLSSVESQGRVIASSVAFTTQVFKTVPYVHSDAPALSLAAAIMNNRVLHGKIREQGGAYGGGAVSNALSGNFYFYSFRDPKIGESFDVYREAIEMIAKGHFELRDIEEAKLEMIQEMDAVLSPEGKGEVAYSWMREGKTEKIRQDFRNNLLKEEKNSIIEAVREYLLPQLNESPLIAFSGKALLEQENRKREARGAAPLPIYSI